MAAGVGYTKLWGTVFMYRRGLRLLGPSFVRQIDIVIVCIPEQQPLYWTRGGGGLPAGCNIVIVEVLFSDASHMQHYEPVWYRSLSQTVGHFSSQHASKTKIRMAVGSPYCTLS